MIGLNLAGTVASRVIADAMSLYRGSFPHTVRVETTNHCQAECTFCPRETIGRAKSFMKQDLFEKVAMECAAGGCKLMHLHGFGEPLLDKQLPERIMLCKRLGIPRVKIFTNGDLLRGDMAKRLLESMVDEVKVSIDGSNGAEFNRLRVGLNFDKVLQNVKEFRASAIRWEWKSRKSSRPLARLRIANKPRRCSRAWSIGLRSRTFTTGGARWACSPASEFANPAIGCGAP